MFPVRSLLKKIKSVIESLDIFLSFYAYQLYISVYSLDNFLSVYTYQLYKCIIIRHYLSFYFGQLCIPIFMYIYQDLPGTMEECGFF
jgi:hypothetical protein